MAKSYNHQIPAKVGTHALTTIFVDAKTKKQYLNRQLTPGVRLEWQESQGRLGAPCTGIVADETTPKGTLFITRH